MTLREAAQAALSAYAAADSSAMRTAMREIGNLLSLPDPGGWAEGAEAMRETGSSAVREVAAAARLTLIHVAGSPGREAWARSEINNEERIQLARLAALPVPPATTAPEAKPHLYDPCECDPVENFSDDDGPCPCCGVPAGKPCRLSAPVEPEETR